MRVPLCSSLTIQGCGGSKQQGTKVSQLSHCYSVAKTKRRMQRILHPDIVAELLNNNTSFRMTCQLQHRLACCDTCTKLPSYSRGSGRYGSGVLCWAPACCTPPTGSHRRQHQRPILLCALETKVRGQFLLCALETKVRGQFAKVVHQIETAAVPTPSPHCR